MPPLPASEPLRPEAATAWSNPYASCWRAERRLSQPGAWRRYLREGGPALFRKPQRRTAFDGLDDWLRERFFGAVIAILFDQGPQRGQKTGQRQQRPHADPKAFLQRIEVPS